MNRAWSIIWKVALCMAIPGLAIGLAGMALGGPRPVQWGPHGPQVMTYHDIHIDEPNLPAFTSIDVNTSTTNVQVVVGDRFGLKVDVTRTYRDITWTDTDGTLTVRETAPSPMAFISFGVDGGQAVITVPATANLKAVSLVSATGQLAMGAPCERLTAQTSTGDVTATTAASIQMNVTSDTGDVTVTGGTAAVTASTSTGSIKIQGGTDIQTQSTTGDATITSPSGSVTSGSSTGDVTISGSPSTPIITVTTSTGRVSVTQSTAWANTWYDLTSDIGRITTNGAGAPGSSGRHITGGNKADNPPLQLQVDTSTGDITVTLG